MVLPAVVIEEVETTCYNRLAGDRKEQTADAIRKNGGQDAPQVVLISELKSAKPLGRIFWHRVFARSWDMSAMGGICNDIREEQGETQSYTRRRKV